MACENKYYTLTDLARQAQILSGDTACFDGKIQAGIPFSGYPTGVDTSTIGLLNGTGAPIISESAYFSGTTGTTIYDISNPLSPNFVPSFAPYSATSWTNPIFSAGTSGLHTVNLGNPSAQTTDYVWTYSETGMTGDHVINTYLTGYTITYDYQNMECFPDIPAACPGFTGITTGTKINYSAGTLDYKGPVDYLRSREDGTIDNRLTTKKLKVTGGASASTIGFVLTQTDSEGTAEWVFNSASASTNTFVVSGSLDGNADLNLLYNTGGAVPPIDLSALSGATFTGNTSGSCISDLFVTNIYGCSPVTFHSPLQHIGSSATGLNSIAWGSGNTSSDNFSNILGGVSNTITGNTACEYNTIVGGNNNAISDFESATSDSNIIMGGSHNTMTARAQRTGIIAGTSNLIGVGTGSVFESVIVGGTSNVFVGTGITTNSVILGGSDNQIEDTSSSSILGGESNYITGNTSGCDNNTIIGGNKNSMVGFIAASSDNNTILGGVSNSMSARAIRTAIIGGTSNIMGVGGGSVGNAVIVGGDSNVFPGSSLSTNSVILGGTGITGLTANTAYVATLNIDTIPLSNNTLNTLLVREVDGTVKSRDASTIVFTGGSGNCITDLYTTNIHSCSPLNINPLDEGNVYFGSTSGVTIDVINSRIGVGVSVPSEKLHVNDGDIRVEDIGGLIFSDLNNPLFGGFNPIIKVSGSSADLVQVGTTIPTSAGLGFGSRGYGSSSSFAGYGRPGDGHIYSSNAQYGLNIISASGAATADYIRLYAGQDADDGVCDMFIGGTGTTRGFVGLGTEYPEEKLHVQDGNVLVNHNQNDDTKITITNLNTGNIARSILSLTVAGEGIDSTGTIIQVGTGFTSVGTWTGDYLPNSFSITTAGGNTSNRAHINIGSRRDDGETRFFGGGDGFDSTTLLGRFFTTGLTITDMVNTDTLRVRSTPTIGHVLTSDAIGNATWQPTSSSFTGNTSGDCIDVLWVSTISGCSPVTIGSSIQSTGYLGFPTIASGVNSIAYGGAVQATGDYSQAFGFATLASGGASTAFGEETQATGATAHAEGNVSIAGGVASHAEGSQTKALGDYSHAEGQFTIASGDRSHAQGHSSRASGVGAHAEGFATLASGDYSHAGGHGGDGVFDIIIASGESSFAHYFIAEASGIGMVGARSDYSAILGGTDHDIYGYGSTNIILGGDHNLIDDTSYSSILGGAFNSITGATGTANCDYSTIIGGSHNLIQPQDSADRNTIIGGNSHEIRGRAIDTAIVGGIDGTIGTTPGGAVNQSVIIGGSGNVIEPGSSRSVILGGLGIVAPDGDMVYVPNLNIDTPPLPATGATATEILVRDSATGVVRQRNINTIAFSGGSGNCITDLFVTNVYGCSPVTVHNDLIINNGDISIEKGTGIIYSDLTRTIGPFMGISGGTGDLVQFGVHIPGTEGMSIGSRGSTEGSGPGYGKQSDGFIYSSSAQNGLNIISQNGTGTQEDYIRFFAGKDALSTADMFISGSSTGSFIGMGTETPIEKLHVEGGNILVDNEHDGDSTIRIYNTDAGTSARTMVALINKGPAAVDCSGIICQMGPAFVSTSLPTFQGLYLPNSLNITTGGGSGTQRTHINIGSRRDDGETRFFGGSSNFNNDSLLGRFFTSGLTVTDMTNTDTLRVRSTPTIGHVLTATDNLGTAEWVEPDYSACCTTQANPGASAYFLFLSATTGDIVNLTTGDLTVTGDIDMDDGTDLNMEGSTLNAGDINVIDVDPGTGSINARILSLSDGTSGPGTLNTSIITSSSPLGINPNDEGQVFIGSTSGFTYNPTGETLHIKGSLTVGDSTETWNDGYLGNDEFIAILPTDFIITTNSATRTNSAPYSSNGGASILTPGVLDYYAMKIIPKGFTATGFRLNGTGIFPACPLPALARVGSISTSATTGIGGGAMNVDISFSSDVDGDGEAYVVLNWQPCVANSDEFAGGKIYIERST